ncbi:hypothetical protein GCM10010459_07940 [Microbacterium schleiferi]
MQVGQVHDVVVDDADRSDAGGGEGQDDGGPEPTGSHDRDAGCSEAALTQVTDSEEFSVARGAVAFGIRQRIDGRDERGK